MDIAKLFPPQTNSLPGRLEEAFKQSLSAADNGDKIISEEELNKAKKAFAKTDEFKELTQAQQTEFNSKLDLDKLWAQQGASAVVKFDGMQKQIKHYEGLLNDPAKNRGTDKPLVTKEQLDYARANGFGDVDGNKKIDGLELAVADLDGKGIGAKDGDLNGDGKVNKDDRGIDLGSSKSSPGFDTKLLLKAMGAFFGDLAKILAPQAPGTQRGVANLSAALAQLGDQIT